MSGLLSTIYSFKHVKDQINILNLKKYFCQTLVIINISKAMLCHSPQCYHWLFLFFLSLFIYFIRQYFLPFSLSYFLFISFFQWLLTNMSHSHRELGRIVFVIRYGGGETMSVYVQRSLVHWYIYHKIRGGVKQHRNTCKEAWYVGAFIIR